MNSNARGVVIDAATDDSRETALLLALLDRERPLAMVNCHGWGNFVGEPPHEDVYRFEDDDPLFAHLRRTVCGCNSSGSPHYFGTRFRLESHARDSHGTHCVIVEPNWNCYQPTEGAAPVLPTVEQVAERGRQYVDGVAAFCLEQGG